MKRITLAALRKGGAIRMLCHYHSSISSSDPKWIATADFARREFRAATPKTISQLIKLCRLSFDEVQSLNITFRYAAKKGKK